MAVQGDGVGWKASPGMGMQAASQFGYTMFCWSRFGVDPGASVCTTVAWTAAAFIKTALWGVTGGWNFIDVDNAFVQSQDGIAYTFAGRWQPVCLVKPSQSSRTLYIGDVATTTITNTTVIGAQTLFDIWVGNDQDNNALISSAAIAEVAIWMGALDQNAVEQLFAGACPLTVRPPQLAAYWPLDGDMINYAPAKITLLGNAPTFVDHPPIQRFRSVLNRPYLTAVSRRLPRRSQ